MKAQVFLDNFGHIAHAPDGVKRLREIIYQLGITGALCRQDTEEGTGALLLEDIEEEKQTRIEQGLFKRSPKFENLKDTFTESLPDIPETWAWTRLVEIGEISPKNVAEDDTLTSFSSMSTISEMHAVPPWPEDRFWGTIKKGYTHFADGDVVVAKITPCFENGKAAVICDLTSGIGAGTTELHVVRPLPGVEPAFIYIFLRSPYFKTIGEGHMTGTAGQKRLPTEYFATRPLPLPPSAEQKRIVAKVDDLMALCDKLDSQQQERERRFPVLSREIHTRLADSPTPTNLKVIFEETETVSADDLRKTILTLAAYGKLVPQQLEEEPAQLLLDRIETQRAGFISEGYPNESEARTQTKKQRGQKLPNDLSTLPIGWTWSTLIQVSLLVVDCHNKTAPYASDGIRLLRTTNIRNGKLNLNEPKFVTEATYEKWSARCKPEPGDILITREAPMGEVCIIPEGMKICMGQRMMLVRICPDTMNLKFLLYSLMEPGLMNRVQDKPIGATVKHLRVGGVETLLIPVPPIAEQHRIVTAVDHLMSLVDRLEEKQNKKTKVGEAFVKAIVAAITGTQIKERDKMKAPKTELVTKLQAKRKPMLTDKAPLANIVTKHKGELSAKSLWQQSGLEIDAFYQQLKTEMANGWIVEPEKAVMKEVDAN